MKKYPSELELSAYLDGELPQAKMQEIALLIAQDDALREKVNALRVTSRIIRRSLRDPEAAILHRSVWQSVEAALDEEQKVVDLPKVSRPVRWAIPRLALGALAIALIVLIQIPSLLIRKNACWVQALSSDRDTVMVFQTKRSHMTVIWAFEDKKIGSATLREAEHERIS